MILSKYDKVVLKDGTKGIVIFSYKNHVEILFDINDEELHHVDIKDVEKVFKRKKINGYDDRYIEYDFKFSLLYNKCLEKYKVDIPDTPSFLRKDSFK